MPGFTCGILLGPIAIGIFINYMWPKAAKIVLKVSHVMKFNYSLYNRYNYIALGKGNSEEL